MVDVKVPVCLRGSSGWKAKEREIQVEYAEIDVHAGDFLNGEGMFKADSFFLKTEANQEGQGEQIPIEELEAVEIATEESIKKIGGTIGWGVAGALILGPVGLLAGLLLGGNKKKVTFVAKFKDGRKLFASTDSKTYTKLQAAVF